MLFSLSCLTLCDHGLQLARFPCAPPSPRVCSNSCPIELVMPSNHLILCCPLLLLPSVFSGIRVFFNESALRIRWPKHWSFSFSIGPSNEYSGLISFRTDLFSAQGISLARIWTQSLLSRENSKCKSPEVGVGLEY